MNQIPRRDRYAEEVGRIREVVGQHPLPEFVTGFDVRLGEVDGDPAMWIVFKTSGSDTDDMELRRRVKVMTELQDAVQADLLDSFDERFPYFRTEQDRSGSLA